MDPSDKKTKAPESFDLNKGSFFFKACNAVGKWFLVSLLTYLCSIPVLTIGTAACAALAVSRKDYADLRDIFSAYFTFFFAYFRKTIFVFLVFLLTVLLQMLNLSFYQQFAEPGSILYYAVMGIVLTLILAAVSVLRFYCYEVTLEEPVSFRKRLKNSLYRMMRCLPAAGLLILMDIGLAATIAGAPIVLPLLLIYPGFHAFLTCLLISRFEKRGENSKEE